MTGMSYCFAFKHPQHPLPINKTKAPLLTQTPPKSLRCLAVIGSVLGRAGEAGHERRLADARRGIVAWDTPLEVQTFMTQQRQLAEKEAEAEARHVNRDGSNPQAADEIRANARGAAGGGERPWERQDEEW